jgi:hypothetical protein
MAYTTHLPVLAGLAILGSVAGVGLGRSTISQINPAYFQTASGHFYGDLVPNRSRYEPSEGASSDYLQADYAYSATPTCIGCEDYPVEYRPRHEPKIDFEEENWAEPESPAVILASAERPVAEPAPANREWIERYTTYTVSTEPVEQPVEVAPAQDES